MKFVIIFIVFKVKSNLDVFSMDIHMLKIVNLCSWENDVCIV